MDKGNVQKRARGRVLWGSHTGLASWPCDLYNDTGPHTYKSPTLGFNALLSPLDIFILHQVQKILAGLGWIWGPSLGDQASVGGRFQVHSEGAETDTFSYVGLL